MSIIKGDKYAWIAFWMWLSFLIPAKAVPGEMDVQGIAFSHTQDVYTWHIAEQNGQEIAIPLPILVRSEERGWDLFLSSHLHHGRTHHNYYIAGEGEYAGKVVEKNSAGEEARPIDFSLIKNACGLFLSCGLLLFIVLRAAHWYKKHPNEAPGGFIGLMEMAISYIQDGVIKEAVGKEYKPFSSYLLTVFFFILINNLIGIIPILPGGANAMGNIAVTGVLALCTFVAVSLFVTKVYWKEISWPKASIYLKLSLPVMPFVEFFGVFIKPLASMIRLFANIIVGYTTILALAYLIFITVTMGVAVNLGMTIVSILFCAFMNCLELSVACLQVYTFILLSTNYIGLAKVGE